MNNKTRLYVGILLMVAGLIIPVMSLPIMHTSWPSGIKYLLAGICFFGFEIMMLPAVAIMGKENYEIIIKHTLGWLKNLKPAGNIGKIRHSIGLILFLLPLVPTYIMGYVPQWLPDNSPIRFYISLASDIIFFISLFVLGGDFWDKLRSLFILESRAWFPGDPFPGQINSIDSNGKK